jgi:biopolymer transport protein ExbD
MSWKVRPEGSATVTDVPTLEELAAGLEEGAWAPTDEVRGPDDADWTPIEEHPQLAEAVALEPLPSHGDDETHIDMTPLIDVVMVLLVFFILLFTYTVLEKRLEAPNASSDKTTVATITEDEVKEQMVHVVVKREDGKTVYRVEDKVVPPERLVAELRSYVRPTHNTLLLESDDDVPHGDVVQLEDFAKEAGIERVNLLSPQEEKKP